MNVIGLRLQCKKFTQLIKIHSSTNLSKQGKYFPKNLSPDIKDNIFKLIQGVRQRINNFNFQKLNISDIPRLYKILVLLRDLVLKFDPELFSFNFVDFLTDEGLWDWVETLLNKQEILKEDIQAFFILKDSLNEFKNLSNIFNENGQSWMEDLE